MLGAVTGHQAAPAPRATLAAVLRAILDPRAIKESRFKAPRETQVVGRKVSLARRGIKVRRVRSLGRKAIKAIASRVLRVIREQIAPCPAPRVPRGTQYRGHKAMRYRDHRGIRETQYKAPKGTRAPKEHKAIKVLRAIRGLRGRKAQLALPPVRSNS